MTLEEEIARLEKRVIQLRIQFDLFFAGGLPKPPLDPRDDLDRDIKRMGSTRDMKLSQRFMYNTLLNRWNIFTELWNKRIQAREEGTRIPAVARRRQGSSPAPQPPTAPAPGRRDPAERRLVARAAISSARDAEGELKTFYRSFLEARQGEGKAPSFEKFRTEIEKHIEIIRRKSSCERVDFRLYLENNKVALKAKPHKEEDEVS
ncbi:MAG TPA: MXAN_5187 C-terminal domain-containing protein [Candidatus Polarisedimenticolia bacterium]|nr:MXAN_5187 C-terminal domain-containing protein [Candidatus Polarisedimenticolia bacterium]